MPQTPASTDPLREQTVRSERVYQGGFLTVRRDEARLPDGSLHPREWVAHPGAAAILALSDQGEVLIERQWRYAMGRAYLEIPAGKIDPGENSLQTARRELLEETGHVAARWALLTQIHPAIGYTNEVIDVYLARGVSWQGGGVRDAGEWLEVSWWQPPALFEALRAGRIPDVKTHIALLHLERLLGCEWPWPDDLV